MRKPTRSILATTAVVGLLALPVAGAGAADTGSTTTTLTLESNGGSLAVTVPPSTVGTPVALQQDNGAEAATNPTIGAGSFTTTGLVGAGGEKVTASDSRTGILRITTVTADSGLTGGSTGAKVAFCQDTDGVNGDTGGTVVCSEDDNKVIANAKVIYQFGTVDTTGSTAGLAAPTPVDNPLGTATLANTSALTGEQHWEWTPTFQVTLLGTELAGKYYGAITHSIDASA